MLSKLPKKLNAFTLIELLVVIGILAILLAIVLVAINPSRQFKQANDTQRKSDVNAILNAIHQYAADNKGDLPSAITASEQSISNSAADLCGDIVPQYIADLPLDPTAGTKDPTDAVCTGATSYDTGYKVVKSATNNRVTVSATPEITPPSTIQVTR
ncbi:hypothetical protein A3F02_02990 [Candidatus Curtissbacteria bacterium RIFCSPHIGHO2_12_FULL_38_9b]|uniref:Type II secretion system protein GspG C-terminal domain-containing protein n=2 Tax=Candidatus Curtissiibacteriota TaxID=1752717 RepID=A0A1F5GZD1_9BACT|nr:MAG: hypothetical protein A3A48_04155 [Candidatus Curtissbacteria bacterium RIFCSPLOWO2_01_FULL_37_9]OGD97223.1 MAG: hypothetical protein A3F02_02990 [Candidatus Curtissbacteria bacterium RIFCSPHIGHO2_12_FULL_38_9b]